MDEKTKIQLYSQLSAEQPLFVIFGIFLALSVYLSQYIDKNPQNELFLQIGITSSLIISVLIAFLILKRFLLSHMDPVSSESGQIVKNIQMIKSIVKQIIRNLYSIENLIFVVSFIALVFAIISLVVSSKILSWILIPICYLAGISLLLKILVSIFDAKISASVQGLIIFGLIVITVYFYESFVYLMSKPFDPFMNYIGFLLIGFSHALFVLVLLAIIIAIVLSLKEAFQKIKTKIFEK
jgi:hypothetical protein